MKVICKYIGMFCYFLLLFGMLLGCTFNRPNIINTNQYIQTDYDFQCLTGEKTFTEIIICYQEQDSAEKMQNRLTNELINKK